MKNSIASKYKDLNIAEINLQNKCKFCDDCWSKIGHRKWTDEVLKNYTDRDKPINISFPWIGRFYEKYKILVIGVNMNGYGGYDAFKLLVDYAISELKVGKKKLFKSKDYPGTLYYHRLLSYASILLEKYKIVEETKDGLFPNKETLIKTFDFISITNSIKCSPRGERGKPTNEMWNNCPTYILKEELKILKPKTVLILGKSDNYKYFKNNVLDELILEKRTNKIISGKGRLNSNELEYFIIPHPASFGGTSPSILNDFKKIIKENN